VKNKIIAIFLLISIVQNSQPLFWSNGMKKTVIILCLSALLTGVIQAKDVLIEIKIQGLYIGYFNRAADKEGLDFWQNRATQATDSSTILKELSAGFSNHPTFASTYSHLSNKDFVEAIYRNVLGKEGDSDGVIFWTQMLNQGESRSNMVSDFIEASLTTDLTVEYFPNLTLTELEIAQKRKDLISNKTLIAQKFTTLLGIHTNITNTSHPEDDPAYLASIKILTDINENASSYSEKITYLSSIINTNDPIREINGNPTTKFSCGTKQFCTEMVSCSEATFHLTQCGLNKLDRDNDGIPCESICN
jgi:hypothetical protein